MSELAAMFPEFNGSPEASSVPAEVLSAAQTVSLKIQLTATESRLLTSRAEATGQTVAEFIRQLSIAGALPGPSERGAEIAVLEGEIEQLRSRAANFAVHNAELEARLTSATAEADAARAAESGESSELRQRIKTLAEYLDSADRHVSSMRSRLDQQTADSSRQIARLEERLREREVGLASETKRLTLALATETAALQKRIEEVEEANARLASEAKAASAAGVKQRQLLEARIGTLLDDIEQLRKRDTEIISDRDRTIATVRHELENVKSLAAVEKAQLKQNLTALEATRQREQTQHTKMVEEFRVKIAALERDAIAMRDATAVERRRFEAALADERDRNRRQLDARDDQRRKVESRANAAEKQATAAMATVMRESARADQLERQLNAERTSRAEEIEALQQHSAALSAQRESDQVANNLVVEELRFRLAEALGEDTASNALSTALERRNALVGELEALRARVTHYESAERSAVQHAPAETPRGVGDETMDASVREQIAEVLGYARNMEHELAEVRAQLAAPAQAQHGEDEDSDEQDVPAPSWRKNLIPGFGAKTAARRLHGR